jgi:hypothetical protein
MDYVYYTLKMANGAATSTMIYRLPDGAFIPLDPANGHYREHLEWIKAGNVAHEFSSPDDARAHHSAGA